MDSDAAGLRIKRTGCSCRRLGLRPAPHAERRSCGLPHISPALHLFDLLSTSLTICGLNEAVKKLSFIHKRLRLANREAAKPGAETQSSRDDFHRLHFYLQRLDLKE